MEVGLVNSIPLHTLHPSILSLKMQDILSGSNLTTKFSSPCNKCLKINL
jgi:hypothetical protein